MADVARLNGFPESDILTAISRHPGKRYHARRPLPLTLLREGDKVEIGGYSFICIETPGHTPGSICLYWPKHEALFTGDLVFDQGIGRTDLPGGSGKQLKESIQRVAPLLVQYLLPGHGGVIAGKDAVRDNFKMIKDYWFRYLEGS
jgi:glyoxylase-like metal-dependent hydrolase (beta-lactamase superfamily II)